MSRTSTPPSAESLAYCRRILGRVSRTFALTIPVLAEPLRTEIGTAYLLCRIADTVEDRADLAPGRRNALFDDLRALVRDPGDREAASRFRRDWPRYDDAPHQSLLDHAGDVLDCYRGLPGPVAADVRACVEEMIEGMRAFLHPGASPFREACANLEELERYCHAVAGTVGILVSRLFARELPASWLTPSRIEAGRRFGLGLQLTNVLKDLESDLARGVSYVPRSSLHRAERGWALRPRARDGLLRRTLEHLDRAEEYTIGIPAARTDLRLFCVLALHLALATLEKVALDARPPKVSRGELADVISAAREGIAEDAALEELFARYRGSVVRALEAAGEEPA